MQDALKVRHEKRKYYQNQKNTYAINALYEYLPSLEEFEKQSEICEEKHGTCY